MQPTMIGMITQLYCTNSKIHFVLFWFHIDALVEVFREIWYGLISRLGNTDWTGWIGLKIIYSWAQGAARVLLINLLPAASRPALEFHFGLPTASKLKWGKFRPYNGDIEGRRKMLGASVVKYEAEESALQSRFRSRSFARTFLSDRRDRALK